MNPIPQWTVLVESLFDKGNQGNEMIAGPNLLEWLHLVQHDFDEVDSVYLDHDVIGG